ncbi:unnamed protein product [Symbiodinium sp. CCMP2592]|nr:unnamed protein product [Symbiodinium sp. CCMP2592]
MACALLSPLGEGGESIQAFDGTAAEPADEIQKGPKSVRSKGGRSDASKTTGGRPRSKKGDGNAMLECSGVVKPLGRAPTGEWQLKHNKAGIPYVTDERETVKKWAMSYFQSDEDSDQPPLAMPMNLSLDRVDEEIQFMAPVKSSPKKTTSETPTPSMNVKSVVAAGQPDGQQQPEALVPVCHCLLHDAEKAECEKCKKGYNQEVARGCVPKFATRKSILEAKEAFAKQQQQEQQAKQLATLQGQQPQQPEALKLKEAGQDEEGALRLQQAKLERRLADLQAKRAAEKAEEERKMQALEVKRSAAEATQATRDNEVNALAKEMFQKYVKEMEEAKAREIEESRARAKQGEAAKEGSEAQEAQNAKEAEEQKAKDTEEAFAKQQQQEQQAKQLATLQGQQPQQPEALKLKEAGQDEEGALRLQQAKLERRLADLQAKRAAEKAEEERKMQALEVKRSAAEATQATRDNEVNALAKEMFQKYVKEMEEAKAREIEESRARAKQGEAAKEGSEAQEAQNAKEAEEQKAKDTEEQKAKHTEEPMAKETEAPITESKDLPDQDAMTVDAPKLEGSTNEPSIAPAASTESNGGGSAGGAAQDPKPKGKTPDLFGKPAPMKKQRTGKQLGQGMVKWQLAIGRTGWLE